MLSDQNLHLQEQGNGQRLTNDTSYTLSRETTVGFGATGNSWTTTTSGQSTSSDMTELTITRSTTIWVGTATYSLARSATSINEGQSVTFTLTTTEVDDGTQVPYTITGISANDLSAGSIQGNFTVNSNSAQLTFTTTQDVTTEGTETMTLALDNGAASLAVQINDTSAGPDTYYLAGADLPDKNSGGRLLLNETDIGTNSTYTGWCYWTWCEADSPNNNYIYADDQNGENIWRIRINRLLFKMTQDSDYLYFIYAGASPTVLLEGNVTIMKVAKSDGQIISRRTIRNGSNFGTFQDPNYGYIHPLDISYNSSTGNIGFAFLLTNNNTDDTNPNGPTGTLAYPRLGMCTINTSNLSNSSVYMKRMAWGGYGGNSVYTLWRYDSATLIPRGSSGYTLCMNGSYTTSRRTESRVCFVNFTNAGQYQSNRVLTGAGTAVDDYTFSEPYISSVGDWSMQMTDATYISNVGSIAVTGIFYGDSS